MKRIAKISILILIIALLSGAGSIFFEHYLFPRLSTYPSFSRNSFLKKFRENTTIINKTEEVIVREDSSVNKAASLASTTVVNIMSLPNPGQLPKKGIAPVKEKSGTGVIVTSDGMIVTYRKAIIESNASYKIITNSGSLFDAKLVGVDDFSNLAFLKIETTNLPTIAFSNSGDFFPGKKVIAIGNSFGEYQNRYAAGLLSNINKVFNISGTTTSSTEKLEGIFETDFADQAEYVGGPLIDYNGELVGIVGSVTVDNEDDYFQIPSNVVKKSIELAIKNELSLRPYVGAYYMPITRMNSISHSLGKDRGALIYSPSGNQGLAIIAGSPAERAGLKIGDIVTAVNGQEINLDNQFSNLLSQYKKGDQIELSIFRDKNEIKLQIKL